MTVSHRALVERASHGDEPALAELLAVHLPGLLAYVRLHCGPMVLARESATDVAQSVCREALQNGAAFDYRGEAAFRGWLFQTAANMIKERQRRWLAQMRDVRREERTGDPEPMAHAEVLPSFATPSQVAIRAEDMEQLAAAFAKLPDDYRQVLTEAKLVGRTHREIADLMGRSEAATRVLLHRALLRLAELLDADGDGRR